VPVWRFARPAGRYYIEEKGAPAVTQSGKTGKTSLLDSYDKPGI